MHSHHDPDVKSTGVENVNVKSPAVVVIAVTPETPIKVPGRPLVPLSSQMTALQLTVPLFACKRAVILDTDPSSESVNLPPRHSFVVCGS